MRINALIDDVDVVECRPEQTRAVTYFLAT